MDQKLIQDDRDSYGSTDSMEEPPTLNLDAITKNIESINQNCRFLEKASTTIGTQKDSIQFRNNIQYTLLKCKSLIDETNKEMQQLVLLSMRKDTACKLQVEKLRNHFKDAVLVYSNLQQVLLNKLRRNLPSEPCPITRSEHRNVDYMYDEEEQITSLQQSFQKTLEDQGEIIEREDRIHQIENDITDINDIMRELATLTVAQGSAVDSIENAVENAYEDIRHAHQELEKATASVNRRWKSIFCLFIMLLIIVITVAVMLYFTLKQN